MTIIITPRLQREAFNNGYAHARGLYSPYLPEHDYVIEHWNAGVLAGFEETDRRGTKVNWHLSAITASDWAQQLRVNR
jgi:uncharacterized protein YutD